MSAGAMTSRRLAARSVAAGVAKRGRWVAGMASAMLIALVAHGCGQGEPPPGEPPPWQDHGQYDGHVQNPCSLWELATRDRYEHFIHWTPDDSRLVFNIDATTWTLDVEGKRLQQVADTGRNDDGYARAHFGHYADVSPDGSRIVYSTCEYYSDGYEIAAVRVDGTDKRRLTEDGYFDHYPVWSPDGKQIAFVRQRLYADPTRDGPIGVDHYPLFEPRDLPSVKLTILRAEKGFLDVLLRRDDVRRLEATSRLALAPPVWSPDGDHLAFIANEGEPRRNWYRGKYVYRYTRVLHTVRADGSRLARIGETTALPAWSPDGDELAYATVDGGVSALYVVRPDGTGRRLIWSGTADDGFAPISQVLWSPDGSEILFFSNEPYLVSPDGGGLRRLGIPRHVPDVRAAWSSDGLRIAIYYPNLHIVTVSRDGAELLVHAEAANIDALPPKLGANPPEARPPRGDLRALDPPLTIAHPYQFDCSSAVPDPVVNPGLIRDCETLVRIRTALFGLGPAGTGRKFQYRPAGSAWREDMPIWRWTGISVGGDPPRVRELGLWGRGAIPADIANLQMLEVLSIFDNDVTGPIPPELGRLTHLESLSISQNLISGGIPPELGALKNLTRLFLSENYGLSGTIPAELGNLENLKYLHLSENSDLSGGIPAELGNLENLELLDLRGTWLSGTIPAELGNLGNLKEWYLPAGVSGCIPAEWPRVWSYDTWRTYSLLEFCKPGGGSRAHERVCHDVKDTAGAGCAGVARGRPRLRWRRISGDGRSGERVLRTVRQGRRHTMASARQSLRTLAWASKGVAPVTVTSVPSSRATHAG